MASPIRVAEGLAFHLEAAALQETSEATLDDVDSWENRQEKEPR